MIFKINWINGFIIFSICCLFSCTNKQHIEINELIEVNLITKNENNPFGSTLRPLSILDSITKEFKGYDKDSSLLGYLTTIKTKDLENLYLQNKLDKDFYKNEQAKIYCLIGYKNGRQFYILDLNKNKNFDDDEIIEFDREIKYKTEKDPKVRDSFQFLNIKVFKLEKDNIYEDEVHLRIFPNANYFSYKKENKKQKFAHDLQLIAQFSDYYYGEFVESDKRYKVAINKYSWNEPELMVRNIDSAFYKNSNQNVNNYKLLDTIKIEETYYKIDKITFNPPKLELKPIIIHDKLNGFRIGSSIENQIVEDLNGNKHTLKDLFESKKLLLLDFWGTWCGPCKELTPNLIALNKIYTSKVSMVSLAYELDSEPVKNYIAANNINWFNGIIKGNPKSVNSKSKIIKDLRIECFPTFIVLDKDLKIVYRTCGGGDSFNNLVNFIDKY